MNKISKIIVFVTLLFAANQYLLAQCMTCNSQYKIKTEKSSIGSAIPATIHKRVEFDFSEFNSADFPLSVNFGDGTTASVASANSTYTYSTYGQKDLIITKTGGVVENRSVLLRSLKTTRDYEAPDETFEVIDQYIIPQNCIGCVPDPFTACNKNVAGITIAKANAYVKFANPNKKYRKVLVFVEGIDFDKTMYCDPLKNNQTVRYGSFGWDVFWMGHKEDDSWDFLNLMPTAFDELKAMGYDVVLVDFYNGADYIQTNAGLLKKILKEVAARRQADDCGTLHQIAVVGASMGGQVAKYALDKMELEDDKHCVNTYISFDSPQQGAGIPLGYQSMALFVESLELKQNLFTESLMRPAARQLLLEHITDPTLVELNGRNAPIGVNLSNISLKTSITTLQQAASTYRSSFDTEIKGLGYPKMARNVAIACGSIIGTPQGFTQGDPQVTILGAVDPLNLNFSNFLNYKLLQARLTTPNGITQETVLNMPIQLKDEVIHPERTNVIFSGCAPTFSTVPGELITLKNVQIRMLRNITPVDHLPGASRSDFADLGKLIASFRTRLKASNAGLLLSLSNPLNVQKFTFMTTASSLDANVPFSNGLIGMDLEDGIKKNPKLIPFEDYYAPKTNLAHVELDQGMINKLKQWLSDAEVDLQPFLPTANSQGCSKSGSTYNFGHIKKTIGNISIQNGGTLYVNNNAGTSYTGSGAFAKNSEYTVYINDCGGAAVNVKDGGKFVIGNEANNLNNKGIVYITSKSTLNVKSGGLLKLMNTSELIVENLASANVEGGTIEAYDNSKVIVQSGATTNVNTGTITLEFGAQIIVQAGATTNINGGTTKLKGNSQLIIQQGGIANINAGTINLQDNARITVQAGGALNIYSGVSVNFIDISKIVVEEGGKMILHIGNGSPIVFSGASSGSNPIEIKGELIANAPIQVNNSAYFSFYPTHKLTLMSTFRVTGNNQKMIQLEKDTRLKIVGQDMAFNTGNIKYENNTRLEMPASKNVAINGVSFLGDVLTTTKTSKGLGMTGLFAEKAPAQIVLNNCVFKNLDVCIDVYTADYAEAAKIFEINATTFIDYRTHGVSVEKGFAFKTHSCFFKSTVFANPNSEAFGIPSRYPPAILLSDFDSPQLLGKKPKIALVNTVITGNNYQYVQNWFNTGQNSTITAKDLIQVDPTSLTQSGGVISNQDLLDNYSYAVYINNVPNFVMEEYSVINNAFNAILARGTSNDNKLKVSRLINNGIGVNMIGTFTNNTTQKMASGRFTMDCASLNTNVFGVLGRNIWLDIDELLNSNQTNFNTFIQYYSQGQSKSPKNGRYFDFTFDYSAIPSKNIVFGQPIPATYNKWSPGLPVQNTDYFIGYYSSGKYQSTALDLGTLTPQQPAANCDKLPGLIYADNSLGGVPDVAKGTMFLNGTNQSTLPMFWTGFSNYLAGNENVSNTAFAPLSALSMEERNAVSNRYAQHIIDIAKTMVYAAPTTPNDIGFQSKVQKNNDNGVSIYPNPTSDLFYLRLPKGSYEVSVFDPQGRNIKQIRSQSQENTIETQDWESGIYQVLVKSENTGEMSWHKIVIVR